MINFDLNLPDFHAELEHLRHLSESIDLGPAARVMAEEIEKDNAIARLGGLDRFGNRLAPIKESTVKGRRRKDKGDGPPLTPDALASRAVANFRTTIEHPNPFTWLVIAYWVDMDFLVFHTEGRGHNPVRDIVGIRPEAIPQIAGATFAEVAEIIRAKGV